MRTDYRNILRNLFFMTLLILLFCGTAFPFGKNKVNYDRYKWRIMKTIHFDIHYPGGMEDLALKAGRIAEEGYVYISNYLRHELTDIVKLVIYPSHISFQNNNILPFLIGEGTGGFTELLKNRVVVPYTGSDHDFRHVLTHELVHAFQFNLLFADRFGTELSKFGPPRIPLWVIEGSAEYLSIGFDETADMIMRDALFNEKYSNLIQLTLLRVRSPYMIYKEGQSFFYFLEQTYGREAIGELFRDLRDIPNLDEAFRASTGKKLEELNREWIRFYKRRYFHLVREKSFDDEEGKRFTNHEKTYSYINICPAVSPDGAKMAYITNEDIYTSIVIKPISDQKKKKKKEKEQSIRVVVKGNAGSKFEGMHLLSNYLTWSGSGRLLSFVAQSHGRDIIYLADTERGRLVDEIVLPMRDIRDPSLSWDGRYVSFIGSGDGAIDIFIYDRERKKLSRVTDDNFMERYPRLSRDNRHVIYSSNYNEKGNPHRHDYNIYRMEIASGKREPLVKSRGNNLQADISHDGKKIIFISNRSGIYNAYIYDRESKKTVKVTDVLSGIFYPRWFPDDKKIAYVSYQNVGYDIFIKELREKEFRDDTGRRDTEFIDVEYPESYFQLGNSLFREYNPYLTSDYFSMGLIGSFGQGLIGIVQLSLSDMLGNHRVIFTSNYVRSDGENDYNLDLAYYYLKYRWDFGIGFFRHKNPFFIYSLAGINELIHNANYGTVSMDHYGGYGVASYPFSRYFRFDIKGSTSRYERDYSIYSGRRDTYANLNKLTLGLSYDNVLWGRMTPADGFRGRLEFERSFDITGQDFSYSNADIDLRKYFLLGKKYTVAIRGIGGKIFGADSDSFKYYVGGYNTLRGHPFLEYSGENMFVVNTEFRFVFIEGIKFGWPLFFGVGNIGGVLFYDTGAAWDNGFQYKDRESGRYDDLKSGFGFGLRFALYPVIILKFDWAWPYDGESVGSKDFIFSIGFEY
jgi:Tol biopolymer transport system component